MSNHVGQEQIHGLTVRERRTLSGDGEASVAPIVYCPLQARTVGLAACEGCERFHALHFDAASKTTSVLCRCGDIALSLAAASLPRAAVGQLDLAAPLADVMTKDVVCVRSDVDIRRVEALLLERAISGVSVVDENGKPIGIVSRTDLLQCEHDRGGLTEAAPVTAEEDIGALSLGPGYHLEPVGIAAGDVMTPLVFALHETACVGQAAALMAFEGIHQVPIVSDAGEVVGIVSSLDLLRWLSRSSGYLVSIGS